MPYKFWIAVFTLSLLSMNFSCSPLGGGAISEPPAGDVVETEKDQRSQTETLNVIVSLNPASITVGQSATLNWQVEGASQVTITPGLGTYSQPNGSILVIPTEDTTYTVTATRLASDSTASATGTASATLFVNPVASDGAGGAVTLPSTPFQLLGEDIAQPLMGIAASSATIEQASQCARGEVMVGFEIEGGVNKIKPLCQFLENGRLTGDLKLGREIGYKGRRFTTTASRYVRLACPPDGVLTEFRMTYGPKTIKGVMGTCVGLLEGRLDSGGAHPLIYGSYTDSAGLNLAESLCRNGIITGFTTGPAREEYPEDFTPYYEGQRVGAVTFTAEMAEAANDMARKEITQTLGIYCREYRAVE